MPRAKHATLDTVVSVEMGSSVLSTIALILTAPLWVPLLVVIDCKEKFTRWKGRKIEAQYLDTRDRSETARHEPFPLVTSIERDADRLITIETTISEQNLAKCHDQRQSPLFALPAELRTAIFEFALGPRLDNHDRGLPFPISRPMCGVNMLQTCRRAWLEANSLATPVSDPILWLIDPFTGVFGSSQDVRFALDGYFQRLSVANSAKVLDLRMVFPLEWLNSQFVWDAMVVSSIKLPPSLTLIFWHAGRRSISTQFTGTSGDSFIVEQAKAAGVTDLRMKFVTKSGSESIFVDNFIRPLYHYVNQQEWKFDSARDWTRLCGTSEEWSNTYHVKTIKWSFVGPHRTSRVVESVGIHRDGIPRFTRNANDSEADAPKHYIQKWESEKSLLKFV